ncbi:MAG: alpha/beta fold hydrolase [Caldilineaceae bacterium]
MMKTKPSTTHLLPGLIVKNHRFQLPFDYANPTTTIELFAREVIAADQPKRDLPYMVYFQGGPGSGSPRPNDNSGWIKRVLQEYRLLLLDQRGTGLSTPITAQTMRRFASAQAQAEYLKHFRADNIINDAEAIRQALIGDQRWSIMGQSYGGFCLLRYLSAAPQGLNEALITGGIPSLTRPAEDVYRATYPRVAEKNRRYYQRYPEDEALVAEIVRHLLSHDIRLPSGGRLTAQRFQQLGLQFGMSDGFEAIHYLLEEAFVAGASGREINWNFLFHLERLQSFDTNPIFSILHEAIYAQKQATRWAAERVLDEFPEFEPNQTGRVLFTGEMIYPWMFDEYRQLQPLKAAAELIAHYEDWPALYDLQQLAQNRVPVAAAVYYDDMYVHRQFSEETAALVPNIKLWITNQYEHNGLRADGEAIVDRLLKMVRGSL